MSNHPSTTIKSRLLRRGLAGILSLALLLSLIPSSILTAGAAGWEDQYIQTLVDWGVMRGDIGGNMAPQRSITRAEFVTMMNRAYGYKKMGGHPFTDVSPTSWYNEDIDIGYNIGYFKGTSPTMASPNDTLTREQAAVLLARNMMLQPTVGETLGFSDSRTLSDWSRGLVGAAAENGIISGYDDGTFQPFRNITRGEVAAMLVRAIGTPVQEAGDHALGNVYGNVTVNTAGVKLRDGVIAGNLYLTGGIDLGDVLLENVTVLGQIIVSGGGESNSSESSVVLRNVVADGMIVDSIGEQFVTIRAEGNTDIPTTTVRTNAYVDDSSLPGYGLSYIELDGAEGALYQLAGNIKDVINKTPGSDMQIVQGSAGKVTVDEEARDSSVLVDGDARVDELNLDTAANVTGTGDIKNLNVGAAGSTVEQLPDKIVIRPGTTADIAGSSMNSTQGAQSSAEPKLLAGYPAVRKIAPQSAELVFRVNKPGTIYWAVSAVADGSVSEADLLEPPVYGNKLLASGRVTATAANTDYTAAVNRLTSGGSYYVTAMLVDGRGEHSPIKVTSFTTPDDSVPAFADGYPVMTLVTTEISQVTVMTTKSCLLYYALLPKGAKAPTEAEFKAAAIPGNLGYGSQSVTKNVTIPINVNSVPLEEKTDYVLYLWLVDHDGAQKSRVTALPFTTLDETPPNVTYMSQIDEGPSSVRLEYTIDESPADLVWAIVTEGNHNQKQFMSYEWEEIPEAGDENRFTLDFKGDEASLMAAKARLVSGTGALASGVSRSSPFNISNNALSYANAKTSSFVVYYIAHDRATASANLSTQIKGIRVHTEDTIKPKVELQFSGDSAGLPQANSDIRLIFSEPVKGTATAKRDIFLNLYNDVTAAEKNMIDNGKDGDENSEEWNAWNDARNILAQRLDQYITLHKGTPNQNTPPRLDPRDSNDPKVLTEAESANPPATGSWINWRNAQIKLLEDGTGRLEILLPGVRTVNGVVTDRTEAGIQLEGGTAYYFYLRNVYDLASPANPLEPNPDAYCYLPFTLRPAQVNLALSTDSETPPLMKAAQLKAGTSIFTAANVNSAPTTDGVNANPTAFPQDIRDTHTYWDTNRPQRIDRAITIIPDFQPSSVDPNMCYDILIWSNKGMDITIYSRPLSSTGAVQPNEPWVWEGVMSFRNTGTDGKTKVFHSMNSMYRVQDDGYQYPLLKDMEKREYAFHVDRLNQQGRYSSVKDTWDDRIDLQINVVAGDRYNLELLAQETSAAGYDRFVPSTVSSIGVGDVDPFIKQIAFNNTSAPVIQRIEAELKPSASESEIGFVMDNYGKVNYVIAQLTQVKYKDTNNQDRDHLGRNDPVTASSIVSSISSYRAGGMLIETADGQYPPLVKTGAGIIQLDAASTGQGTPLKNPEPDTVLDGEWPSNTILKGSTDEVMGGATAWVKDLADYLEPNSIYIICVVPEGRGGIYNKTQAQCYYFTTPKAAGPILTFDNTGGMVVTAMVDRTATVNGKLFYQNMVSSTQEAQVKLLSDYFVNHVADTTQWSSFKNSLSATEQARYADNKYTVMDALYDSYTRNSNLRGPAGDYPTFFDVFADKTAKDDLYYLITNPILSNVVKGHSDAGTLNVSNEGERAKHTFTFTYLDGQPTPGVPYVCVAVAVGDTADLRSFRALPNRQVSDVVGPSVIDVNTSGLHYTPDATGSTGTVTGTITVDFDTILHKNGTPGVYKATQSPASPAQTAADLIDGKYYGLGGVLGGDGASYLLIPDATSHTDITSIDLKVQDGGASVTNGVVSFSLRGLADSRGITKRWNITVTYNTATSRFESTFTSPGA